jgi:hypothetical protein
MTAEVRDFPLNHRTIAAVIRGEMPDPEQRANVALAIIADLPIELRRGALLYIRNTYPNGE